MNRTTRNENKYGGGELWGKVGISQGEKADLSQDSCVFAFPVPPVSAPIPRSSQLRFCLAHLYPPLQPLSLTTAGTPLRTEKLADTSLPSWSMHGRGHMPVLLRKL